MSSSTALLPSGSNRKNDHPIFLRACHSPWLSITQKLLVFLRAVLAAYLVISFLVILDYELEVKKIGWFAAFKLSNIVFGLQALYACVTFTWTFMHLYYPHNNDNSYSSVSGGVRKLLSPSRRNTNSNEKYSFSVFHWASLTFPHLVTFIHWVVLVPRNEISIPSGAIFDDKLATFYIFNKFGFNSVLAFIELFILSSIKRSDTIWSHAFAIAFLILLYVGWAAIGNALFCKYSYFFLDHEKIGWEYYWASVVGMVFLAEIFYVFVHAITGVRESMTKRQSEDRSTGYQRLPQ
ncbi:hypothetical protein DSL72_003531 [Monilinia vaccinii-corymbosi]|uniref:FAR-17a/AIG1-like protein n=1 Tax=Monilinia vaccinii-corymbosi TaxID=61207 RepID=A0A8A3P2K6_9HELO|nr:hypothetical protein DSL72_003531 [Monilinia vaccinii-corymbosi]